MISKEINLEQKIYNNVVYKQEFTIKLNSSKSRYIVSIKNLYTGINPSNDMDLRNKINKIIDSKQFCSIGGWMDTKTNLYYIDANLHIDNLSFALIAATTNKQKAIFDTLTNKVVIL